MSNKKELSLKETLHLPVDLGDGLLLRWAKPEDAADLAAFNVFIHTDNPGEPEEWIADWTKDLMNGRHPTTSASDFTIVVDHQAGGNIVSTLNLISQTWTYDGIPFPVGRVELVATHPAYRRRGLIRRQMDVIHQKSAARGELVQAITGVPWFYRQFGYEMAINLEGGRLFIWARPGNDKPQDQESYGLRLAVQSDIPDLQELYEQNAAGSLIMHQRSREIWAYELSAAHREMPVARKFFMVEDNTGKVAAYAEFSVLENTFIVSEISVRKGHSWRAITLFLVRELRKRAVALNKERKEPITAINFRLGDSHPVYEALGSQLEKASTPYNWYIRVPDLPRFLRHITPVLERRLASGVMAGHNGTLRLNFYSSSLTVTFEDGRITDFGSYEPKVVEDADALFPDLTFLQLLFGHRSYDELDYARADCSANDAETAVLLRSLFPRRPSAINPLN